MPLAAVLVIVAVLLGVLFVAIAREPGSDPADAALAYEAAFDRLDFALLFDLAGDELRDGLDRDRFVAAKRAAYAGVGDRRRLAGRVDVDRALVSGDSALVVTRVTSSDGEVRNDVRLERRGGRWVVVGYALRPPGGVPAPTG